MYIHYISNVGGDGPEGRQEVRFLGPISVNLDTVLGGNLDIVLERILDTVLENHLHIFKYPPTYFKSAYKI